MVSRRQNEPQQRYLVALTYCRLHGLSLGSNLTELFEDCISEIGKLGGADLFDTYIYHGYAYNPDSSYERLEKLIEICAKYAPKAKMRQGENGCISEWKATVSWLRTRSPAISTWADSSPTAT